MMQITRYKNKKFLHLVKQITIVVQSSRQKVAAKINHELLLTYWQVGKYIVNYEQQGTVKAEYGKELLLKLANILTKQCGKGFSRSNLFNMRNFYLKFPKIQTVSGQLPSKIQTLSGKFTLVKNGVVSFNISWSHYCELLKLEESPERNFYYQQTLRENWSVRELKRQMNSALFQRLALSKNKRTVLSLAKKGHIIKKDTDIIKDPYVLEFLNIPQFHHYSEKHFEQKLIDNLQHFLLELGKGFTFVGRQHRVTVSNVHYYIDLVFYHRILKCFVLIDLKIGEVTHQDIGQMNMYLNYFQKEQNVKGDNAPIGIILSREKDEVMVEYATGGLSNKVFVSKYQLHLPQKKILKEKMQIFLTE